MLRATSPLEFYSLISLSAAPWISPLCLSTQASKKTPLLVSCEKKPLVRPQKLHFMLMQHISDNSGFWQHKPAPVHAQFWSGQNTTELGMGNSRVPSNDGNTRGLSPCTKYKGLTFCLIAPIFLETVRKVKKAGSQMNSWG